MTDNLKKVLNFTDSDLVSNREGYLSQTQQFSLKRKRLEIIFLILIVVFPINLGGIYSLVENIRNNALTFDFATGLLIPAIIILIIDSFVIGKWHHINRDLVSKKVYSFSGKIELKTKIGRTTQYQLVVDEVAFKVSKSLYTSIYDAVEKDQDYRVYYTPNSKIVLLIEPRPRQLQSAILSGQAII